MIHHKPEAYGHQDLAKKLDRLGFTLDVVTLWPGCLDSVFLVARKGDAELGVSYTRPTKKDMLALGMGCPKTQSAIGAETVLWENVCMSVGVKP